MGADVAYNGMSSNCTVRSNTQDWAEMTCLSGNLEAVTIFPLTWVADRNHDFLKAWAQDPTVWV